MFRSTLLLGCLYFLTFTPYLTIAMTPEQKAKIHEHFEKLGMECITDNPITEEDIMNLKAKKPATGEHVPCFAACIMRKIGVMDSKGMLQKESALQQAKEIFEDPEEIQNIGEYLHSCGHVNDAAVGDGEKGCERAMLAFVCMKDNASKFGFDL